MTEPDWAILTWLAMHEDCPIYGCGDCADLDVDFTRAEYRQIAIAAKLLDVPVDVFMNRALREYIDELRLSGVLS